MLSYRHAFHAGNFADVLKHLVLIRIIDHLKQKEKPFCFIDTHAGPGLYDLEDGYALKNREFDNGVGLLWRHRHDRPENVSYYLDLVRSFNHDGQLKRYPGSPAIAQYLLRPDDRLHLFELHGGEIGPLGNLAISDRRIKVVHADGLRDAVALLPPAQHRALVLIDPSYEIKSDYQQVVDTLAKMYRRFAGGVYALWYPVVERRRIRQLERAIADTGISNIQLFELGVQQNIPAQGMTASGMIVVNPPWTLAAEMRQTLPWLASVLGRNGAGSYRAEILAEEMITCR